MITILIPSKNEPRVDEVVEHCTSMFNNVQTIVCNDREGKGKGWAIRKGLEFADGEYVCFIDGDMDIHPRMIKRLLPFLVDYDIVIAKKQIRGSLTRRMVTRISRAMIRTLFRMDYDTQTGLKIFHKDALPTWENDRFMFDLEILSKAHDAGFSIIEVPVEVTAYGSTSKNIKGKNIFSCFLEMLKIWRKRL